MSSTARRITLGAVAVLLIGAFVAWWFSGFSLEFGRFFAAERTVGSPTESRIGRASPPPGCHYEEVQCIQAPCDPVLVCPTPAEGAVSCTPFTQSVGVNEGAIVIGEGGNGSYQFFAPGGVIAIPDEGPTNQILVAYPTIGEKKVTVQSTRADGTNVDSIACTVIVQ